MADDPKRPRTRQRRHKSPPVLVVPDINDDPTERKRVLSSLAQRRYRERKRERLKAECANPNPSPSDERTKVNETPSANLRAPTISLGVHDGSVYGLVSPTPASLDNTVDSISCDPELSAVEEILDGSELNESGSNAGPWSPILVGTRPDGEENLGHVFAEAMNTFLVGSIDLPSGTNSLFIPDSHGPSMPSITTVEPSTLFYSADQTAIDLLAGEKTGCPSSSIPSTGSSSAFSPDIRISPDTNLLPVYDLNLLGAVTRIAVRLKIRNSLWDLSAMSPFYSDTSPLPHFQDPTMGSWRPQAQAAPWEQLPIPWRPTRSQLSVPHHPLIDVLPWPGVRERIISLFSLPESARPAQAVGPTALVNFAYDLEDSAEGLRVWGSDVYDPNGWEVGQVAFQRWWFLFDREVVEVSNRWRRLRGAPPLRIPHTTGVVSEIPDPDSVSSL